jgi:hypothetical protein
MSRVVLFALSICACTLAGCNDGWPIVKKTSRVASPDAMWEAVLEEVDNGLGFGQGVLFHEIHIQPPGTRVTYHLNESVTCVYYVGASPEAPKMEWVSARRLVVTYSGLDEPGRQIREYMDVEIEYRRVDPRDAVPRRPPTAASGAGD